MTNKEFYKKFNGVTSPPYRGAPKAAFDPNAINEAEFHDDLQFKDWTSDLDEETQTLTIKWRSQCWPTAGTPSRKSTAWSPRYPAACAASGSRAKSFFI